MLGNTCKVLSTAIRKNILLSHRLKDLHQSVVNWLWNRLAFYAHKVRFITEFPIGKDEFQVYLVGRYGQQVEVLWERRVKNGLFQLIASPGSHTNPVFELNFAPERVNSRGGHGRGGHEQHAKYCALAFRWIRQNLLSIASLQLNFLIIAQNFQKDMSRKTPRCSHIKWGLVVNIHSSSSSAGLEYRVDGPLRCSTRLLLANFDKHCIGI